MTSGTTLLTVAGEATPDLSVHLQRVWKNTPDTGPLPRWEEFLPADDASSTPALVLRLLQMDIEFRIRSGRIALLGERYFEHPRVRLSREHQVALIRWEYRLRWECGERARLASYTERFPALAADLKGLQPPSWKCPECLCDGLFLAGESVAEGVCPRCAARTPISTLFPARPGALQVPGYVLEEVIGQGGMGMVYRALDTTLHRAVAIKVLNNEFGSSPGVVQRFVEEAQIAGQLQHPGIPAIHELGTLSDGRPFLAMKLIKGRTLADLLDERASPAQERGKFVAIFEAICHAVGYAHAHDVIHRDLKPANVMVGAFGEVQVMDWGLAKVLTSQKQEPAVAATVFATLTLIDTQRDNDSSRTQAGSVMGTPAFMPPEQAIGAIDRIDARSDVFALGGILLVILTGKPPYGAENIEATRQLAALARLGDALARLDACGADPDLVALCKRCLSPDPGDRPADAGAMAFAVADLRADADERARQAEMERVRAEAEAREQRIRRRVELALFATVGLLVLAGGCFAWWQNEQNRVAHQRLVRNGEAVGTLVTRCEEALRANAVAKAAVALEAAERQAGEGGADEFADRLERCRTDLMVLRDLDAIDQFRWSLVERKYPDGRTLADRSRAALARFGIEPEAVPATEAAARVARSSVRDRLVTALDRWLLGEKLLWVRQVLQEVDPDPDRDAIRDNVLAGNKDTVVVLAARLRVEEQPLGFVAVLGENKAIPTTARRALLRAAVHRWPGELGLLMTLGETYRINQKDGADERVRWFQAAVGVDPGNVSAHNVLGNALFDRGDLDGAGAEYREALRLDPTYVYAHYNLGNVLRNKGDLEGAIVKYRDAMRLDPKYAAPHSGLALVLKARGDLDAALAAVKDAIQLDPRYAPAHNHRGLILRDRGDLEGASAEYKEAFRLDPLYAIAPNNLGTVLRDKGDLEGAIARFKEALRLDPKYALAQNNLTQTERMRELLPRLPDVLASRSELIPSAACEFARLCARPFQKRYLAAVRLYEKAFGADPKLADNLDTSHRYNAACYAALAAGGQGAESAELKPAERAELREKALRWLRADLALRQKQAVSTSPAERKKAATKLAHWLKDMDLAGTRPGAERAGWTTAEAEEWDRFWADVRAALAEAQKPVPGLPVSK
jgi:serine/threonine protein kinase/Flp pilus assembly protein TadD